MGGDFVIDNSVVMAWCFEDEANGYSDAIQEKLIDHTALVPAIGSNSEISFASGLFMACQRSQSC